MKAQIRSRRRRLGRWLTVALAAAFVAVPTAQAGQELGQYSSDGPRTGPLSDQGLGFSTDGPRTGIPQVSEPVFSTDGPRTGIPLVTQPVFSTDGPRTGIPQVSEPVFSTDGPRTGLPPIAQPVFSTDGPRTGVPSATPIEQPVVSIETALRQLRDVTGVAPVGGPALGFDSQPAPIAVAAPVADDAGGIQWADALVGVAIGIAIALIVVGVTLLVTRRREPASA